MVLKSHILFLVLLLATTYMCSQELAMEVKGVVQSSEKEISDVHVLNTSAKKATITDAKGNFSIFAQLGDTLVL